MSSSSAICKSCNSEYCPGQTGYGGKNGSSLAAGAHYQYVPPGGFCEPRFFYIIKSVNETSETQKKSAFVAVIGRPSAGKSTLLNALCGEKVAIVSPVPQTTRNTIRGIVNRPAGQLVFIDTPGRHASDKKLNKKLMDLGDRARAESELVLYVIDATRDIGDEEQEISSFLAKDQRRMIVAINKIDAKAARIQRTRDWLKEAFPDLGEERILTVSALKGDKVEELLAALYELAPQGEQLYSDEVYTDQDVPFRIAEIIREKAISRLRDELPHALYVEVEDTEIRNEGTRLWVRASIIVERESQKGIVVGKGGLGIKAIRQAAQKDLNRIFDWKVELDLRVKASKDWRQDDRTLRRLID